MQHLKESVTVKVLEKEISDIHVPDGDINENALKRYYGNHIRAHPNDLKGMKDACRSEYYHSISTDDDPQHQYCLVGAESWCKYKALALHQDVLRGKPFY